MLAVGLQYDSDQVFAPSISVKGERWVAEEIVKLARRFSIPLVEKPALARALKTLDLDQEIPESLYESVALLLQQLEKA